MAYALNTSRLITLIMPKRHVGKFIDLIPAERHLCLELIDSVKTIVEKKNKSTEFDICFDSAQNTGIDSQHCSISITSK